MYAHCDKDTNTFSSSVLSYESFSPVKRYSSKQIFKTGLIYTDLAHFDIFKFSNNIGRENVLGENNRYML